MSYRSMKQNLITTFDNNDYYNLTYNRNYHHLQLPYYDSQTIKITLEYPGRRSKITNNELNNYDYRLLLNGQPPVHNFLINDLYEKSENYPNLREDLIAFLIDLAINGDDIDLSEYNELTIIDCGTSIHDLSILIPILVLQEDLNYPRPRKGRTLSFYRYIEAVFAADPENIHDLPEVQERTNNHGGGIPPLWPEYREYYLAIDNVDRP